MRKRHFRRLATGLFGIGVLLAGTAVVTVNAGEDDPTDKVRAGLKDRIGDFWIYDNVEQGYAAARKRGMPLLVSFRCVP